MSGTSSSGSTVNAVTLAFGNPFSGSPPWAKVTTAVLASGEEPILDTAVFSQAVTIAQQLWSDGWELAPLQTTIVARHDPIGHWDSLRLSVTGSEVEFRTLRQRERWVAIGKLGTNLITLDVHGITPRRCRLEVVRNFEPFLQDMPNLD